MPVDKPRVEAAVRELLLAIGEDPERDGLQRTPRRVSAMFEEIFAGIGTQPGEALLTQFESDHDEMVLVKDIPFASLCEHHLVPFLGKAHVAYIPNEDGCITGLSKVTRLVLGYAQRLQVQERMTSQIADDLMRRLDPQGVIVVLEAEHLCMTMRGVRTPGSTTVTSAVRGLFRDDARTRAEVMAFIRGQ
jgi:GTP cyclohydrolase I